MDKLKRYFDCYIPIEACNLRCHYCYITCHRKFNNNEAHFQYTPVQIKQALTQKRLGGTCLFNLCGGGETLIPQVVLEYAKVLLENGHYVSIVTNGLLTPRFEEMAKWPKNYIDRLFFKFSYHYLELKKRDLFDKFFSNVKLMRDAGASFTVEVMPNDELMPYVDDCILRCEQELGAKPHLTVARDERNRKELPILTKMDRNEYYNFWSKKFDSELFEFKYKIFQVPRKEFCYAGNWSGFLLFGEGILQQCNVGLIKQNIFKNPNKKIWFPTIGKCQDCHCFNGHSWIALGDIPEIKAPNYAVLRNRICNDGSEWLQPKFEAFISQKLYDNNHSYNIIKRNYIKSRASVIKLLRYIYIRHLRTILKGRFSKKIVIPQEPKQSEINNK